MASSWSRLIRFLPRSNPSKILIGQPVDPNLDIGLSLFNGTPEVLVKVFSGSSVLAPGEETGQTEVVDKVLSPLDRTELGGGCIRCVGLNYVSHAAEMKLALPKVPPLFLKPSTALSDPWPQPCLLPKITQVDNTGDYESELAIILGKEAKDVSEQDAASYVLGYTAANDVSSRTAQWAQSQWSFSKGFDMSCPLGPVLVSSSLIPDPSKLRIRGLKNNNVMQDCGLDDMIFSVPQIISFLSQGTTLPAGTVILTGTPPGVGEARKELLKDGDRFMVEILPHVGTLVTEFKNQ